MTLGRKPLWRGITPDDLRPEHFNKGWVLACNPERMQPWRRVLVDVITACPTCGRHGEPADGPNGTLLLLCPLGHRNPYPDGPMLRADPAVEVDVIYPVEKT